ncbi:MAG: hypothetical protein MJ072_00265 [Clostridia bacterium]|nr:hypothetical protein [Clostridia bacterium]
MKIMFVCSANVVRSAMAEIMFNEKAEKAGIDVVAVSAGINAVDGLPMTVSALNALRLRGYDGEDFNSKSISDEEFSACDHVFVLSKQLKFRLPYDKKVEGLGEFLSLSEVKDPAGKDFGDYLDACATIDEYTSLLIEKLGGFADKN